MVNEIYFNDKKSKIYSILKQCIENVPYYRDSWNIDLVPEDQFDYNFFKTQVPILDKDVLRSNTEMFIADTFKNDDLAIDVTSGTEGKPMVCYKSKEERIRCSNALWLKRRSYVPDLSPQHRFARFYAFRSTENKSLVTNTVLYKGNDILIPLFDMSQSKMTEYWERILEFKPRWIHGPSTAIFNIVKHVRDCNLPKYDIEFVELNGEFVPEEHIQMIKEVLKCKVANHYGSREFWALGFSCSNGKIHILDNRVFIESIYKSEYNENEILVTSLTNYAWPLVRYRIGDIADVFIDENCGCESKGKYILDLKRGRKADFFKLGNGQIINAILFSGVIRGLSNIEGKSLIYQYQIIKKSDMSLEIKLCINKNTGKSSEDIIDSYNKELRKTIGEEIEIYYSVVDIIPPDKFTGKCKDFIDLTK